MESRGRAIYDGKVLFVVKVCCRASLTLHSLADYAKLGDKTRDVVSPERQDKYVPICVSYRSLMSIRLKKKLESLYGWTKGTFSERQKV